MRCRAGARRTHCWAMGGLSPYPLLGDGRAIPLPAVGRWAGYPLTRCWAMGGLSPYPLLGDGRAIPLPAVGRWAGYPPTRCWAMGGLSPYPLLGDGRATNHYWAISTAAYDSPLPRRASQSRIGGGVGGEGLSTSQTAASSRHPPGSPPRHRPRRRVRTGPLAHRWCRSCCGPARCGLGRRALPMILACRVHPRGG